MPLGAEAVAARGPLGLLLALWLPLAGTCASRRAADPLPLVCGPEESSREVRLEGWFHVIWNDSAQYYLSDSAGHSARLWLGDELQHEVAPLHLDRERVGLTGTLLCGPTTYVRVATLELR